MKQSEKTETSKTLEKSFSPVDGYVEELVYKICNVTVRQYPCPHMVIPNFLPEALYEDLVMKDWPHEKMQDIAKVRPVGGYKDRKAWHFNQDWPEEWDSPWRRLVTTMHRRRVQLAMAKAFGKIQLEYTVIDSLLVEDGEGYSIGPHTDTPQKICSALLYFDVIGRSPSDLMASQNFTRHDLGTSIYVSKEGFTCTGGPHYDRDTHGFEEAYRVPYIGNTFVCFLKTNNSFHGVEPVPSGAKRRVYIWNLRTSEVGNAAVPQSIPPAPGGPG